jgi:hypothetical protein
MTDQVKEVLVPIVLGLGVGLIAEAVSQLLLRSGRVRENTKGAWRMLAAALALTVGVAVYLLQPGLTTVPNLARLSVDEAAQTLRARGFEPSPRYESSATIEDGLVVPESQRPIAGQTAGAGVTVTFAVSTGRGPISDPAVRSTGNGQGALSWNMPAPGAPLEVIRDGSGLHRASVAGLVPASIPASHRLLLWVRPVRPPSDSPGWYLQRPPGNGVSAYSAGGSWDGVIQLGNREFPPNDGDVVDLAISVVSATEARALEAGAGAVTAPTPRGSQVAELRGVRVVLR